MVEVNVLSKVMWLQSHFWGHTAEPELPPIGFWLWLELRVCGALPHTSGELEETLVLLVLYS